MGVETIAYSISKEMMLQIKRDNELLEKLFEKEEEWKVECYAFAKAWDDFIRLVKNYSAKAHDKLNAANYDGDYWDHGSHDIWSVDPAQVKSASQSLAGASYDMLKKMAMELKTTNYDGEPISEDMYPYYIGDIEEFKQFLSRTASQEHYLLFATA